MTVLNISEAKTADLVAFYNANIVRFPDGVVIKKFTDRKTAEKRVADLVEKIAAHFPDDETPEGTIPNPNGNQEETQESNEADGAATDDQPNETAPEPEDKPEYAAPVSNDDQPESVEPAVEAGGEAQGGAESQEEEEEDEEEVQQRAAKSHSAFNALQATLAAVQAQQEKAKENGEKTKISSSVSKASNSEGVAASWVDSNIRAARLTRDGVSVELDGKNVGVYKSTREAFRNLRLPDNKHIRFRLRLKEAHRDHHGESATFEHNGKNYVFTIVQVDA